LRLQRKPGKQGEGVLRGRITFPEGEGEQENIKDD